MKCLRTLRTHTTSKHCSKCSSKSASTTNSRFFTSSRLYCAFKFLWVSLMQEFKIWRPSSGPQLKLNLAVNSLSSYSRQLYRYKVRPGTVRSARNHEEVCTMWVRILLELLLYALRFKANYKATMVLVPIFRTPVFRWARMSFQRMKPHWSCKFSNRHAHCLFVAIKFCSSVTHKIKSKHHREFIGATVR